MIKLGNMMDANDVISSMFPDKSLRDSLEAHPTLHSRLTEFQVHTLLGVWFNDHKLWTTEEIYARLNEVAKTLNEGSIRIFPNRLSDDGYFAHYKGRPE